MTDVGGLPSWQHTAALEQELGERGLWVPGHCCCSVAKWYLTLQLHGLQHARLPCPSLSPKFMSIESVMISNHLILCHPLLLCLQFFQESGSFPMSQLFASGNQSIGTLVLVSIISMNIQGWFPLGLTGLISLQSKGLSKVFSNTTVQKHQFFNAHLLYGSILTPIHDYWKNHRFD